uniref:hypothetical protein n=1 Tax=Pedobacter schmidteae TaxID=2201271 RepID=UPI000EB43CF1|nr:hypothetical protein [Pedobacter schmidteae]
MSTNQQYIISKKCEFCDKPLHGRSDQRFCNDTCRNTFNRNIRKGERIPPHPNTKEIFEILQKNYEILKKDSHPEVIVDNNGHQYYNISDFYATRINTKFITSIYVDEKGNTWNCVFDRGYFMDFEQVIVKDFPVRADIF